MPKIIRVSEQNHDALVALKLTPSQSHNDVVSQLLKVTPENIWDSKKRGELDEEIKD